MTFKAQITEEKIDFKKNLVILMDVQFKFRSCCLKDTYLVAQMVKSACSSGSPVQSMGVEDLLQKGMTTPPGFLPGELPWTEEPGRLQSMEVTESDTTERLTLSNFSLLENAALCASSFCCSEGKLGFAKDTHILVGKVLKLD